MQKSLSNATARQELLDRLDRLSPESARVWGTMTAHQMLAHLADWMLMAKGELKTAPIERVLRYPPLKQLAIYWLPFPRGVPTAPELKGRKPLAWSVERAAVWREAGFNRISLGVQSLEPDCLHFLGRVHDAKIVHGLGMGLDQKALEALKQWKFQPAEKDGQPVNVLVNVEVNFRLY